jgi:hypothetical protein
VVAPAQFAVTDDGRVALNAAATSFDDERTVADARSCWRLVFAVAGRPGFDHLADRASGVALMVGLDRRKPPAGTAAILS